MSDREAAEYLDTLEAAVKRTHLAFASNKGNATKAAAAEAVAKRDLFVKYLKEVRKVSTYPRRNSYGSRSGSSSGSRHTSTGSRRSRSGGRRTKRRCRS
jgi:hypothetical protein